MDGRCVVDGCSVASHAKSMCKRHYEQTRTGRAVLLEHPATAIEYHTCAWCDRTFVRRVNKGKTPTYCSAACRNRGRVDPASKSYKSGWRTYVFRPDHPNANVRGYIAIHRLVASKALGRPLLDSEIVHHINHDNQDNRPENLAVLSDHAEHARVHGPPHARRGPNDSDRVEGGVGSASA